MQVYIVLKPQDNIYISLQTVAWKFAYIYMPFFVQLFEANSDRNQLITDNLIFNWIPPTVAANSCMKCYSVSYRCYHSAGGIASTIRIRICRRNLLYLLYVGIWICQPELTNMRGQQGIFPLNDMQFVKKKSKLFRTSEKISIMRNVFNFYLFYPSIKVWTSNVMIRV